MLRNECTAQVNNLEMKAGHYGQFLHGQLLGGLLVGEAARAFDLGRRT